MSSAKSPFGSSLDKQFTAALPLAITEDQGLTEWIPAPSGYNKEDEEEVPTTDCAGSTDTGM